MYYVTEPCYNENSKPSKLWILVIESFSQWDQADMNLKIFHYLIHHYFDLIPEIKFKFSH
jgi:hypothetical protein